MTVTQGLIVSCVFYIIVTLPGIWIAKAASLTSKILAPWMFFMSFWLTVLKTIN